MHRSMVLFALVICMAAIAATAFGGAGGFQSDFDLERCTKFLNRGGNEYFPIRPGSFRRYEGFEGLEFVELEIRCLPLIQPIKFFVNGRIKNVPTRVVEEREWVDGELAEVSRNFFASCMATGDVFYFGESVTFYENGAVHDHHGTWRAGKNGALPGMQMPADASVGVMYFQEVAPGVALDQAEHVALGLTFVTAAGTFTNCLRVRETTPLEPGFIEFKNYAPGVGLIGDDTLELVAYHD